MRPIRRATVRAVSMVAIFAVFAWLFAGAIGLGTALATIALWRIFDPPPAFVWGLAAVLLAATPIVLVVEGLPASDVVGAQFGLHHLAAHRMVEIALLVAMFAALIELLGPDQAGRRPVSDP